MMKIHVMPMAKRQCDINADARTAGGPWQADRVHPRTELLDLVVYGGSWGVEEEEMLGRDLRANVDDLLHFRALRSSSGAAPAKQGHLKAQGVIAGHVYDTWGENVERGLIKGEGGAERFAYIA